MDWKKTLGAIVPGVATMLGGPLAGMASSALLNFFGIESTGDSTKDESLLALAVQKLTPEQAIELKKIEADLMLKLKQADIDLVRIQADVDRAQIEVNKIEVASESKFKSFWRPFIGWACGITMVYSTMGLSLANWILMLNNINTQLPAVDTSQMWPVLFGMLGMGAARSYDRKNMNASK